MGKLTPLKKEKRERGFTLVELLAVVIIIGILAAVAIPAYRHHLINSKAQEAAVALPQIFVKENNYYMEFRTYVAATYNPENSKYTNLCNGGQAQWNPNVTGWQNLGYHPPNPGVYFQYYVNTGIGTALPNGDIQTCYGLIDANLHYPPGTAANWFTICARGDLRGRKCNPLDPVMVFGMSNSANYKRVFSDLKRGIN